MTVGVGAVWAMAGPLPDARAAPRIRAALETEPKWRDRSADDPLQETTKLKDIGNPYCYSNSHTVNIFINNACFLVKGTQCAGVVLVNNLINRAFCRLASLCRQSRRSTAARFPLNCGREDTFDLPEGVDPRSATTGGYICAGVPERRCHRNLCAEGSGGGYPSSLMAKSQRAARPSPDDYWLGGGEYPAPRGLRTPLSPPQGRTAKRLGVLTISRAQHRPLAATCLKLGPPHEQSKRPDGMDADATLHVGIADLKISLDRRWW